MKRVHSIKKRCPDCYIVVRRKKGGLGRKKPTKKVIYVFCKKNPKHKQKQA